MNEQKYIHTISGDIQTLSDWRADYESMDKESWHGKELEDCKQEDWVEDGKLKLIECDEVTQVDLDSISLKAKRAKFNSNL